LALRLRADFFEGLIPLGATYQQPPRPAARADVLDHAFPVQPLDNRADLFPDRAAQDCVADIKAFSGDHPARNVIGAQQLE
jgi:hypothetical protein